MRQSESVFRGGAEEVGEQSRRGSWCDTASTSHSCLRTPDEASQIPIRLNRQIPELETSLSLRKQTTTECSNRQKIQFCSTQNLSRKLLVWSSTRSSSGRPLPSISNCELLRLEILQLAGNKHRRSVLIANFEPNDFLNFKVCLASLGACIATRSFRGAGLQPRRKVHKFNRALAPEVDSFKFSRRPSRRTRFSLSPADLVEELARQECDPK
jgi:hypothetical protein